MNPLLELHQRTDRALTGLGLGSSEARRRPLKRLSGKGSLPELSAAFLGSVWAQALRGLELNTEVQLAIIHHPNLARLAPADLPVTFDALLQVTARHALALAYQDALITVSYNGQPWAQRYRDMSRSALPQAPLPAPTQRKLEQAQELFSAAVINESPHLRRSALYAALYLCLPSRFRFAGEHWKTRETDLPFLERFGKFTATSSAVCPALDDQAPPDQAERGDLSYVTLVTPAVVDRWGQLHPKSAPSTGEDPRVVRSIEAVMTPEDDLVTLHFEGSRRSQTWRAAELLSADHPPQLRADQRQALRRWVRQREQRRLELARGGPDLLNRAAL